MVDDDNEIDEVEEPHGQFVYDSPSIEGIPKDVTNLSVQVPVIESCTFRKLNFLVEVQLCNGLQSIGQHAFAQCSMLKYIDVTSTVHTIGEGAFFQCKSLEYAKLCEGLTSLCSQSFEGCIKLSQISVPSTVGEIAERVFKGCIALAEVELKEGLHTIGSQAFCNCHSLATISVPYAVKIIEKNAFESCRLLTKVEIPRSVKKLSNGIFMGCKSLRTLPVQRGRNGVADPCLPFSIGTIGENAFSLCKALVRVSLSSTVDKIGDSAFSGCDSLLEVQLSQGLRYMEQYSFAGCNSLCGIAIPSTTLKVGQYAFIRCRNLMGVEFPPESKATLFQGCFRHCETLVNICLPPCIKIRGGVSIFTTCWALTDFLPHGDLVEFMGERSETMLPIHKLCYFASQTSVQDLQNELSLLSSRDDSRDVLGMTPFHIAATASKLRPDLLQILLDHYPLDHLGCMDKRDKVMMEYLLLNSSPHATIFITTTLKRAIVEGMTSWGLEEWRTEMTQILETIDWSRSRRNEIWRQARTQILTSLSKYAKVEVASILELALWKVKLKLVKPGQEQAVRATCRTNSGTEVVLSNVLEFYSDRTLSAQSAFTAMSMFTHDIHWVEHVSPDPKRKKSYNLIDSSKVKYALV